MLPHVRLAFEDFGASRTFHSFVGMSSQMVDKVNHLGKRLGTKLANMFSLFGKMLLQEMRFQQVDMSESFWTFAARIFESFFNVDPMLGGAVLREIS